MHVLGRINLMLKLKIAADDNSRQHFPLSQIKCFNCLSSADFFFKVNFFDKFIRNTIGFQTVCIQIRPPTVMPDVGPNCLQRLSAGNTSR